MFTNRLCVLEEQREMRLLMLFSKAIFVYCELVGNRQMHSVPDGKECGTYSNHCA
jgi:hypothetical protein